MGFAITEYGIYKFEMLELLKDYSYIICTSSDNSCMPIAQGFVSQNWINGVEQKRCRATLQNT